MKKLTRNYVKHYLKRSKLVYCIAVWIIFIYLKFSHFTSKWHFIMPSDLDAKKLDQEDGIFFALWHNKLAYAIYFMREYKNIFALVSPHSDGKILESLILMNKYNVIRGSTNKNSGGAIKEIIKQITTRGGKIVITPDGPRGPVYKNGSIITKIASKYNKKVIPVSCRASRYFCLRSWDRMLLPKPFSTIWVTFGSPLLLTGDNEQDRLLLENTLNSQE